MKGDKLTAKQEAFCIALEIKKMTQRQAYIAAFGHGKSSDAMIDVRACEMAKKDKVQVRLAELRGKVEQKAIWTKEEMLDDLKTIKNEAISYGVVDENGKVKLDASVRNVAIKAIERAAKMLGYDEPIKIDGEITIKLTKEIEEYGE